MKAPSRQDPTRRARIVAALKANSLTIAQLAQRLRERRERVQAHITTLARAGAITAVGEVVGEDGRRHKQWLAA